MCFNVFVFSDCQDRLHRCSGDLPGAGGEGLPHAGLLPQRKEGRDLQGSQVRRGPHDVQTCSCSDTSTVRLQACEFLEYYYSSATNSRIHL